MHLDSRGASKVQARSCTDQNLERSLNETDHCSNLQLAWRQHSNGNENKLFTFTIMPRDLVNKESQKRAFYESDIYAAKNEFWSLKEVWVATCTEFSDQFDEFVKFQCFIRASQPTFFMFFTVITIWATVSKTIKRFYKGLPKTLSANENPKDPKITVELFFFRFRTAPVQQTLHPTFCWAWMHVRNVLRDRTTEVNVVIAWELPPKVLWKRQSSLLPTTAKIG